MAHVQLFPPLKDKFKVWVFVKQFATFLIFLKWHSTVARFTEYQITIFEIGLFDSGANLEAKIYADFFDNMAMFFEANNVREHFKYWLSSSNLH